MATKTANSQFSYDQLFNEKTLNEWVIESYTNYLKTHHYPIILPQPGSFDYDCLIMGTGFVLYSSHLTTFDLMISHFALGVMVNYDYWNINKPYDSEDSVYLKPNFKLEEPHIYKRYRTFYAALHEEIQEKYQDMCDYIIQQLPNVFNFPGKKESEE